MNRNSDSSSLAGLISNSDVRIFAVLDIDDRFSAPVKKMVSFQKRITKYKDHIFTFLYHPNVPPDNNGSERAIRNVKVKQKISGQFKILNAAENFAILRSIIDTAIKNNQNVVRALSVIAAYKRN